MTKKIRLRRRSLAELLSGGFDLPLEALARVPLLELKGDAELALDGCLSIKKYEPDEIIVLTSVHSVRVSGSRMTMSAFAGSRITVRGRITGIEIGGDA